MSVSAVNSIFPHRHFPDSFGIIRLLLNRCGYVNVIPNGPAVQAQTALSVLLGAIAGQALASGFVPYAQHPVAALRSPNYHALIIP